MDNSIIDNLRNNISSLFIKAFLDSISGFLNEKRKDISLNKAGVGSTECEQENLREISQMLSKSLDNVALYNEEELLSEFDKYYNELQLNKNEDVSYYKLKESFCSFVREYLEVYNKSISFGERRILEITREMKGELKNISNDLQIIFKDKDTIKKLAEYQSELNRYLVQNNDIPYIDINKLYGIKIGEYETKYIFYENTFDFDKTIDKNVNCDDDSILVFRFLIKNIGHIDIEKIEIGNINIMYAADLPDDKPEEGLFVMQMTEYKDRIKKNINILPNGEEFVQIIIAKKDEQEAEDFLEEYYYYDRLYLTFDIVLKSNKEYQYKYILFLSREDQNKKYDSIYGRFNVDYSIFMIDSMGKSS